MTTRWAKKATEWVGGWSDVAVYVRVLAANLRSEGVRARAADTSPYVAHLELKVARGDLRRAKAVLRRWGCGYEAEALGVGREPVAKRGPEPVRK